MAITNFIPEIWSAVTLTRIHELLVYSQPSVINRDYEGDIRQEGDTVHITSLGEVKVRDYQPGVDITWDDLDDSGQVLHIDQSKYFAFKVDDIDKRQAKGDFVTEATGESAQSTAEVADTFVATTMAAGVDAANNLGPITLGEPKEAYSLLVKLRTRLKRSKAPAAGRWVVVPPEMYALLLEDDRFIRADSYGSTEPLLNGEVGRAAGFTIHESNTVPEAAGKFTILAGHPWATTYADQILNTEAIRLENSFKDGVRGLHVYGSRVTRPKLLASAEVAVS